MEQSLLRAYFKELAGLGIDYGWDDLWLDYRISVIQHLFTPVAQHAIGVPPAVWWPHLDRAFSSFDDLDCMELL